MRQSPKAALLIVDEDLETFSSQRKSDLAWPFPLMIFHFSCEVYFIIKLKLNLPMRIRISAILSLSLVAIYSIQALGMVKHR